MSGSEQDREQLLSDVCISDVCISDVCSDEASSEEVSRGHRGSLFASISRGATGLAPALVVWALTSCAPQPTVANVRSLQGTGAISFLCLGPPSESNPLRKLDDCTHLGDGERTITDFGASQGGAGGSYGGLGTDVFGEVPHLYALVTQTVRGEVAIIDLTAGSANVLDHDPSTPGDNFLQIGGSPTAIVSTPGSTATFVATAETNRPAIYALPTHGLRPCGVDQTKCNEAAPTISSWPACVLPATPGSMTLVTDPTQGGKIRKSCGGVFEDPTDPNSPQPDVGNIDLEGGGRQKLLVSLPELGELAVIDAQALLETPAGSTSGCVIERTIPLESLVKLPKPDPPATGPGCVSPPAPKPGAATTYVSQPVAMTQSDGRLYVTDLGAPLIHVLDETDPCDMVELDPLLPASKEDPTRVVVTTEIAVSPRLTPSFKRFLYAVDVDDKSVMVFDVSDGAVEKTPLVTPNPTFNPLQPVDRIRFAGAPQTLQIVVRDQPKGANDHFAPFGTLCNPDPNETGCSDSSAACQGTVYRTSTSDYASGAGPLNLRGTFAIVGLSTGQLAVIDVEDYDAPCRGPIDQSKNLGCGAASGSGLVTSKEQSCNVVELNAPRSANYIVSDDNAGRHLPGITTFPLLYDKNATLVETSPMLTVLPQMHATAPEASDSPQALAVNGISLLPESDGLITDDNGAKQNTLLFNLEDPRVHIADQDWTVTFEGPLPGFAGKTGALELQNVTGGGDRALRDDSSLFCTAGVQSLAAVREALASAGLTGADLDAQAHILADRAAITNALPEATNPYWKAPTGECTFQACQATFGDDTTPTPQRDIVILEAYEDHLDLDAPGPPDQLVKCCFPGLVSFDVRPGNQWAVVGSITGFLHHVIADPATGHCRDSCDPHLERMSSRARFTDDPTKPVELQTPMFRFYVTPAIGANDDRRGQQFRFTTEGSFSPLRVILTNTERKDVRPESITFLPSIDQLVLTDGALEGVLLVNGTLLGDPKQYF